MKVFVTNTFKRAAKKLHRDQVARIEEGIEIIRANSFIGEPKIGDLAGAKVYKLHISHQHILLVYLNNEQDDEITLLSFYTNYKC